MSVNIPFKVDDLEFSPRELKLKEAETLKTIQEINDNLSSIAESLKVISEKLSTSGGK